MPVPGTDPLSPLAHEIIKAGTYDQLVVAGGTPAKGGELLANVSPDQLLTTPIVSRSDGQAMVSGLWLWHDGLDPSHTISQNLYGETGSFWHAIMHRREGDFGNAKYWYARCADHPTLTTIAPFANDVLHPMPADKSLLRLMRGGWDPNAFVDLVEQVHARPDDVRHKAAVALQRIEWRLLFDHCTRAAVGQ
jgi:hypothetical protein